METRWDSLLSHPDSCPTDGVHLSSLALGILIVVAFAGISELIMADARITGGAILLFGCLGVLFMNVLRAGQD